MSLFQGSLIVIITSSLLVTMILCVQHEPMEANAELDNLTLQFQNGFDMMSKNIQLNSALPSNPPVTIGEADQKMRELYTALERNLMEARQRAANARSSVTFETIEKLNLV